jgi:hypothetical protein
MKSHPFRIVNVFAETPLGGNPLAVFEDGRGFDDATYAGARAPIQPVGNDVHPSLGTSDGARAYLHADLRDALRGHPTLGTAHVVRALANAGDSVTLEMTRV